MSLYSVFSCKIFLSYMYMSLAIFSRKEDDVGQNKTVKPSAYMVLLRDGVDVSGQVVSLGDPLTMTIELDAPFRRQLLDIVPLVLWIKMIIYNNVFYSNTKAKTK